MKNDLISRNALKTGLEYHKQPTDQAYETERQWAVGYNAGLDRALYSIAYAHVVDAVPVVHGLHCIDIVDFIDWLDVGHLRSADEKCFSEANVAGMLKDFAITNPAIPATVTRCKDCRYGLPCKLFGRDAVTCTEHREEIHPMDWYCADAAKIDGKDYAK